MEIVKDPDRPVTERAEAITSLLKRGKNQGQIAEMINRSDFLISQILACASLSHAARSLVDGKDMTLDAGYALYTSGVHHDEALRIAKGLAKERDKANVTTGQAEAHQNLEAGQDNAGGDTKSRRNAANRPLDRHGDAR